MRSVSRIALAVLAGCFVWRAPSPARAGENEYAVIHLEGAMAVSQPQRGRFRLGGGGALTAFRGMGVHFSLGARLRAWVLGDGPAPADPTLADPGRGGLGTVTLVGRLGFPPKRLRVRGVGLFIDGGGGGAITGTLLRAVLEASIGYGIAVGRFVIAPVARFVQVLQPGGQLDGRDARMLVVALELHALRRPRTPRPSRPAPEARVLHLGDRDADGILDGDDACIEAPEDRDGYEDEDGCPDPGIHAQGGSR